MNTLVKCETLSRRLCAGLMMALVLFAAMPIQAIIAAEPPAKSNLAKQLSSPASPSPRISTAELMKPIKRQLTFSADPSDFELFDARVFSEPLVPMDNKEVGAENQELASALLAFKAKNNPEEIGSLTQFVQHHPNSRWNPSLEENIAQLRFDSGYFTDALKYWAASWDLAKHQTIPARKAVADQAISRLVQLESRLGRTDDLKKHLAQTNKRELTGSVEARVSAAQKCLLSMQLQPEKSFLCGPVGLQNLAMFYSTDKTAACSSVIRNAKSTLRGTNLAQISDLAEEVGLKMQAAKRSAGYPSGRARGC